MMSLIFTGTKIMCNSNKNNALIRGFTLIEMIVAVGIMMLVFTAAGTCLMSVQQTWQKTQERNESFKKLMTIDKIVNANFPNIIPFEWKDDQLRKRNIFLGDSDKVVFATFHRVNIMKEGSIRFVTIFVKDDKLIVGYRNTPILFWNEAFTPAIEEEVASGVDKVSFLYADFDREKRLIWDEDWDEEVRRNLPLAIQMTIYWKNGEQTSWLRRTAGSGKRENFGRRYYDRLQ